MEKRSARFRWGATVSFLGTAENGFYMISYNGQTGYSLADYLA